MEILLGSAILIGVGLSANIMFKKQREAQKSVEHDQDIMAFHQTVATMLKDVHNCNATFKVFYDTAVSDVNALNLCDTGQSNNCFLGQVNGPSGMTVFDVAAVPAVVHGVPIAEGNWISPAEKWRIDAITMPNISTTGTHFLIMRYAQNPRMPHAKTISKHIPINLRFNDTGGFIECFSSDLGSVKTLQDNLCDTMNPGYGSSGEAVMATWDETQQKCVILGRKICSADETLKGYLANGTVDCRKTKDSISPSDMSDNTPASACASGRTKLMKVGTTLRVVCD